MKETHNSNKKKQTLNENHAATFVVSLIVISTVSMRVSVWSMTHVDVSLPKNNRTCLDVTQYLLPPAEKLH